MASIKEIEGVGEKYADTLRAAGVHTTEQLIELGSTSTDRMRLADETHLTDEMIKRWVHMADLFRIRGIGGEYAELLCTAGVCTVPKLAYRSAESLYAELVEYNNQNKLVRRVPSVGELEDFIVQAKKLPKVIHH